MTIYKVSFQWYNTNTYCTYIVTTSTLSAGDIIDRYKSEYGENVYLSIGNTYDLTEAKRRGMPVVEM